MQNWAWNPTHKLRKNKACSANRRQGNNSRQWQKVHLLRTAQRLCWAQPWQKLLKYASYFQDALLLAQRHCSWDFMTLLLNPVCSTRIEKLPQHYTFCPLLYGLKNPWTTNVIKKTFMCPPYTIIKFYYHQMVTIKYHVTWYGWKKSNIKLWHKPVLKPLRESFVLTTT